MLGSAALVGFSPDVIARATQRCADLFGEGMTMMSLAEAPFSQKDADLVTTYLPEELPDLGPEDDGSQNEDESSDDLQQSNAEVSRSSSRAPKQTPAAVPRNQTWFCPFEDCTRQVQGFGYVSGLRRHLARSHKMTEDEIDELLDDDQEMDGAIHVDGFLKPMRNKRGLRGTDKKPRKKGRWAVKDTDINDVEDYIKEEEETSSGDSTEEVEDYVKQEEEETSSGDSTEEFGDGDDGDGDDGDGEGGTF